MKFYRPRTCLVLYNSVKLRTKILKYLVLFCCGISIVKIIHDPVLSQLKRCNNCWIFGKKEVENWPILLKVFQQYNTSLVLFDVNILQNMDNNNLKQGQLNFNQPFHPSKMKLTTFAVHSQDLQDNLLLIIKDVESLNFTTYISSTKDPRMHDGEEKLIPSRFLAMRNNSVIQILILHERRESYFWIGPLPDSDWKKIVDMAKSTFPDKLHSIESLAKKVRGYAQAVDKKLLQKTYDVVFNQFTLKIPYPTDMFIKRYRNSRFIECNHKGAKLYNEKYGRNLTEKEEDFVRNARNSIKTAKNILDSLNVPFFLNSGTLLGWYRECDVFPHDSDVDLEIKLEHYTSKILEGMILANIPLIHKVGMMNDSLQFTFLFENSVKVDVFFSYEENDFVWFGCTDNDGQTYRYEFPKFELCLTEFLNVTVHVPCDTRTSIEYLYGPNWSKPVKQFHWKSSPVPNRKLATKFNPSLLHKAFRNYQPIDIKNKHQVQALIKSVEDSLY